METLTNAGVLVTGAGRGIGKRLAIGFATAGNRVALLARSKAEGALAMVRLDEELKGSYILAADTVVAVGRRILPKAELLDEAAQCLRLLSGRNHRVHTSVCLVTPKETFRQRHVETRVRFKRLSDQDIESYLASGEWRGKAGGYAAQGIAGTFLVKIVGSYSNIVGLPLYETMTLLGGEGFPVHFGRLNGWCPRFCVAPAADGSSTHRFAAAAAIREK